LKKFEKIFSVFIVLVISLFLFFESFAIVTINNALFIGMLLIIYGLVIVILNLGKNHFVKVFFSAILFYIGILLTVVNLFEILDKGKIIFPSLLFILGGGFFMLFLDNPKEKIFLLTSIILFVISIVVIKFFMAFWFVLVANQLGDTLIQNWQILVFFLGIGFLLDRENST